MIRRFVVAAFVVAGLASPSFAQNVTYPIPNGFAAHSLGTATISATTTSSSASITSAPTAWVQNKGLVTVCVAWGDSTVVATYPCPVT